MDSECSFTKICYKRSGVRGLKIPLPPFSHFDGLPTPGLQGGSNRALDHNCGVWFDDMGDIPSISAADYWSVIAMMELDVISYDR